MRVCRRECAARRSSACTMKRPLCHASTTLRPRNDARLLMGCVVNPSTHACGFKIPHPNASAHSALPPMPLPGHWSTYVCACACVCYPLHLQSGLCTAPQGIKSVSAGKVTCAQAGLDMYLSQPVLHHTHTHTHTHTHRQTKARTCSHARKRTCILNHCSNALAHS